MMNKIIPALLLSALLVTGCASPSPLAGEAPPAESPAQPEAEMTEPSQPETPLSEEGPLDGLTLNEYEGLEISAAILPRRAILPGTAIPVTVNINNSGDQTVLYTLGSGAFETPQALVVGVDGLQPVIPQDQLGMMTMDFVTKALQPGGSLTYTVNVMAVNPDSEFDGYTHNLYLEDGLYIADLDPADLLERYPGLEAVQPGSYTGEISFLYSIEGDGDEAALFSGPTGYAQATLEIGVSD